MDAALPAAPPPDALTLLGEGTEAFRALLTEEGLGRMQGTPRVRVGWQSLTDERHPIAAVAEVVARFTKGEAPDSEATIAAIEKYLATK